MNEIYCSQFVDVWQDSLILVSYFSNRVYLLNRFSGVIEKEYVILDNPIGEMLFRSFVRYNDILLLVPYNAESFVLIDLESGKQKKIDSVIQEKQKLVKRKFWSTFLCDHYAWILGEEIKELICIDLKDNCNVVCRYNYEDKENWYWTSGHIISNGMAYIPGRCVDDMLRINIDNCSVDVIQLNGSLRKTGFLDIAIAPENKIVLFDEIGNEFYWSVSDSELKCVRRLNGSCEKCSRQSVVYGDKLFRIMLRDDFIEYRKEGNEYSVIDIPLKQTELSSSYSRYQEGKQIDNLYYFQNRRGDLFVLDLVTAELKSMQIKQSKESQKCRAELLREFINPNVVMEGMFELKDFLNMQ